MGAGPAGSAHRSGRARVARRRHAAADLSVRHADNIVPGAGGRWALVRAASGGLGVAGVAAVVRGAEATGTNGTGDTRRGAGACGKLVRCSAGARPVGGGDGAAGRGGGGSLARHARRLRAVHGEGTGSHTAAPTQPDRRRDASAANALVEPGSLAARLHRAGHRLGAAALAGGGSTRQLPYGRGAGHREGVRQAVAAGVLEKGAGAGAGTAGCQAEAERQVADGVRRHSRRVERPHPPLRVPAAELRRLRGQFLPVLLPGQS